MAATIAKAIGIDKTREKSIHRLGHQGSTAQANTWRTFTECHVNKDGSGYVSVLRDGKALHVYEFGPEES